MNLDSRNLEPRPTAHPAEPIRLVAVDLDGTLLDGSKRVSERTVNALACLPARDARVVIASARPPRSVRHIYRALKLDTWQINYNGALIWDEPGRRVVHHEPLDGELACRIVAMARDLYDEILVSCEILDRWYTDRDDQTYTTETGRLFKPDLVAPLEQFCNQPVTKLMLLGEEYIISILKSLVDDEFPEVAAVRSDPELLQITHPDATKATALERVAAEYGIPMSQVMAIGDEQNDLTMLRAAGVGVAMDNAHPAVKKAADWVAPSNNDHGVHAALLRFGLCD